MAYGTLVTELRADLSSYKKDLEKALKELKDFHEKAQKNATTTLRIAARSVGSGSGGGGGSTLSSRIDPILKAQGDQQKRNAEQEIALANKLTKQREDDVKLISTLRTQAVKKNADEEIALARKIEQEEKAAEALRARMRGDNLRKNAEEEIALSKKILAEEETREKEFQAYRAKVFQQTGKSGVAILEAGGVPQEVDKVNTGLKKTKTHLQAANKLMSQFRQAVRVTAGYTAAIGAGSLVAGVALLGKEALKLNVEYEHNRQTIAHILGMTTQWVDQQGKAVSQSQQLNLNYAQADRLLPQIRLQAAKLNMTFEEGAKLFSQAFGMAGKHGITAEQALPLVGQISELAKELGSDPIRELRSLLGGLRPAQSKIVMSLGIDPKALRQAMQAGHLLEFLHKELLRGIPYIAQYEKSWEVLSTALSTGAQEVLRIATQRIFERIKEQVGNVNSAFTEENIEKWGKAIGDALMDAYNSVNTFVHSDAFKGFSEFFKLLIANSGKLLEVFAAFKSAALVGSAAKGLQGLVKEARGATAAGGVVAAEGAATTGVAMQLLSGGGLAGLIRTAIIAEVVAAVHAGFAIAQQRSAERQARLTERETANMRLSPTIRQRDTARTALQRAQAEVKRIKDMQADQSTSALFGVDNVVGVDAALDKELKKAEARYKVALDNFNKADKAFAEAHDKVTGETHKKNQQILHQEFLQYQQFQDSKLKDELYLKRLQAKDKDDYVHQEHAKLSAAILAADKALHTAGDKLKARQILEKNFHDELEALRTKERLETHLSIAQDLDDRKAAAEAEMQLEIQKAKDEISDPTLRGERIASLKIAYRRKVADVDREETQKALDLVKQFQDAVRKEGEERVQTAQKVRKLELEFGREMIHLTDERKKAIKNLYRTEAEEELKKRKSAINTERLDIRKQARQFLDRSGISRDILEQLTSNTPLQGSAVTALQERFEKLGLPVNPQAQAQIAALLQSAPSLNDATQAALMQQTLGRQEPGRGLTANSFSLEDIKAAEDAAKNNQLTTGQDILEKIATILINTNQFGFGTRMNQLGAKEDLLQRDETQQKVAQEANDVGKAFEEAQKQVVELNDRQKELVQSYVDSAKQIKDGFMKDMQNIHSTLVKLAPEFKHMYDQLVSSKVPIPAAFKGAFAHASHAPTMAQVQAASGGQPNIYNINVTVPDTEAFKRMLANLIRAEGLKGNPLSKP